MRKVTLNQTINKAYSIPDSNSVELKSAMIGLCADIERYFKVAFNVNLNEEIEEEAFRRILYFFPRFGALTIEQFNRFILLFINIRGINAHLYLSKPVYLDDDLKQFIIDSVEPAYAIEDDKKLTMYGASLVLIMLSQKYMVWPYCTSFLRYEFFMEIGKSDMMSKFQIEQQKIFNSICGIGKPLTQNAEPIHGVESSYANDVLKKCLTLVFFDLEMVLSNSKNCGGETVSLSVMLKRSGLFEKKLISKLVKLRNCWFHGSFIGDTVECDGEQFEFTLEFAIETLKELRTMALTNIAKFGLVINDISYFGHNFFNYYALRLVEVSYKILDNRLLTEDKLESRLVNMDNAFKRFESVDSKMFDMFGSLLSHNKIRWSVGASKFLDKFPRKFDCENLKIVKIHSNNGFIIGGYRTDRKDIVLANVEVKKEYKNLVNGMDLRDFECVTEKECSKYISIVKAEI